MNLWKVLSLSWNASPFLNRLLWSFTLIIQAIEAMGTTCLGMAIGPNALQINLVFTSALLFFATHVLVSIGVRRNILQKELSRETTAPHPAEYLLSEFDDLGTPLRGIWRNRWVHIAALALLTCAYILVTTKDVSPLRLELLISVAVLMSALALYLPLLLATNYTWNRLLSAVRKAATGPNGSRR
jgi:hypothetical protein